MRTADITTVIWSGKSGRDYTYEVYPLPPGLRALPGNYIFAKQVLGLWLPVYVGQTENLAERFEAHHKAACIKRNGATHIHAHLNHSLLARLAEEQDLLDAWETSCNG